LDSFDAKNSPQAFLTTKEVEFVPELKVGNNQIHQGNRIYQSLQRHGLFSRSPLFPDKNHPIKIGVINASPETPQENLRDFLVNLKSAIDKLGFSIESVKVDGQSQQKIERLTRANLENAANRIEPHKPDILLVLFPGDAGQEQADDDDEDSMYHALKSHTIRHGIPSQVVYEDTFKEEYAMDNIALGILAKTRNIPFVLAKPLPYADVVVGIDIARRQKKRLSGSVNATAIARIYFSDGQFLRYVIHDAPIDGETIPSKVLRDLFPMKEFQGKKVVIHRDGLFRGDEKQALKNWASEIKSEFLLVEVIKSGAPRLYQQTTTIDKPAKGTAFKLNSNEAFLVSSPPPFKGSTPRPLHIRTDGNFSIEKAIHSVLSLTLLHYGSVREPRLPVTIHYSDKIAELSLLGIKPKDLEGDMPFWL
jgi:argonaute-like protein implicated in RNA metabolism and viral defense